MNLGVHILYLCSTDLEALMRSLNLGPNEHEHDDGHDHHGDEHAGHDHRAVRWSKRSRHEHHEEHERNVTWEEVYKPALHMHNNKTFSH